MASVIKICARAYSSSNEHIASMRHLYCDAVQFNRSSNDVWVCQQSKLLFDSAEDAFESHSRIWNNWYLAVRPSASTRRRKAKQEFSEGRWLTSSEARCSEARADPRVSTPLEMWCENPFCRLHIVNFVYRATEPDSFAILNRRLCTKSCFEFDRGTIFECSSTFITKNKTSWTFLLKGL